MEDRQIMASITTAEFVIAIVMLLLALVWRFAAARSKAVSAGLTGLLVVLTWFAGGRMAERLRSPYEKELAALLESRTAFDRLIRVQSAEVVRQANFSVQAPLRLRTTVPVNMRSAPQPRAPIVSLLPSGR